jgi:hypothetical protein
MNLEQIVVELVEPLKKLIEYVRPEEPNMVGWLGFAKSGDVILSVEYNPRIGYVVLATNEPELAIKIHVTDNYQIDDDPVTYGDINEIYAMVIKAINDLEGKK